MTKYVQDIEANHAMPQSSSSREKLASPSDKRTIKPEAAPLPRSAAANNPDVGAFHTAIVTYNVADIVQDQPHTTHSGEENPAVSMNVRRNAVTDITSGSASSSSHATPSTSTLVSEPESSAPHAFQPSNGQNLVARLRGLEVTRQEALETTRATFEQAKEGLEAAIAAEEEATREIKAIWG